MAYGHSIEHRNGGTVHLEPAIDEWYGQTFAALGDSIVWAGAPMLNRMRSRLGFLSYRNLGVSGRPMADGTANGVGTVTTALANNFATDSLVYIAAGTNDFRLNVPLGTIGSLTQTSHSRSTFYGAYRTTIDHLLAQNTGVQIVLATPLQRNNRGYSTTTTNTAGHMLRDYRSAVFALGDMYSLPVVDLYALSGISEKTLSRYTLDGLHPNEQGYVQMARVVVGQLRSGGMSSGVPELEGRLDALEYRSGARDIGGILRNGWAGSISLLRIGAAVSIYFENLSSAEATSTVFLSLPAGFRPPSRPGARVYRVMITAGGVPPVMRQADIDSGGNCRIFTTTGVAESFSGSLEFTTPDAIPTTLPGDPA